MLLGFGARALGRTSLSFSPAHPSQDLLQDPFSLHRVHIYIILVYIHMLYINIVVSIFILA